LNLYTSIPVSDSTKIAEGFEKKYGIKVNLWRAGSVNVRERIIKESQSSQPGFDVVAMSSVQTEALSREKLLQRVHSPYINKVASDALPSHKEWLPVYYGIFVQAYNTKSFTKDQLPKSYEDLLDPNFKGPVGLETSGYDWFSGVIKQMGEEKGKQYFQDLVPKVSVRKGYSALAEMVASNEVPYALTVFSYKARQMKAEGAPIDWYTIDPAIARSIAAGISKNSKNPNSAALFMDYFLSDGQQVLVDMHYDPANEDYVTEKMNLYFIKDEKFLDEFDKWFNMHSEIIIKRVK
jgi:iron(III) transport system substrate-binding protein